MNEVDFDGIIEELEEMGISNKHALTSRLALVIAHLLKWQFQPNMRSHSWTYTIEEQRDQAINYLEENPSLKSKIADIMIKAYKSAIIKAAKETGLNKQDFPSECPYTFDQIMDDQYYPQ